jgi:hypothetical protein
VELQRELVADQEAKRGKLRVINGIIGMILFLAIVGGGGWYYYMHRTNPKDSAVAYFKAIGKQDWKTIYNLTAFSDTEANSVPDADTLAKQMSTQVSSNPFAKAGFDAMDKAADTVKAGDPTFDGNKATVPITWSVSAAGRTIPVKGTAHMINVNGIWKLDATGGSAQKASLDLVGQPDLSGLGTGR